MHTGGPINPNPGSRIEHFGQEPGSPRNLNLSQSNREGVRANPDLNSRASQASQQAFEPTGSSQTSSKLIIGAKPLSDSSSSLKSLASKVINWLSTTSLFSCIRNLIEIFFGRSDVPQENNLSREDGAAQTSVLPQVDDVLDLIGNREANITWSRRFTIDSKKEQTFDRTLREFSSSVSQYDDIIGKRKFKLTINGKEYFNSDSESADTALKGFFGVKKDQVLQPESKNPLNIAKYYIANGVNNLVDDDKYLPDNSTYSKQASELVSKNILVEAEEGLSEIHFIKKKGDPANVFRFEIIEEAKIDVLDPSSGTRKTLAENIKVKKEYTVTQNEDGSCTIEGKKTIKKQ